MASQKYKLIRVDERHHNGDSGLDLPTYRVMAARTIKLINGDVVHPGDMGGFVDNERCLSHDGDCWIADYARAYGNTIIKDNALARGKAVLGGPSRVKEGATLSGNAMVAGFAAVRDSCVEDEARVGDHAQVLAGSVINGRARAEGYAQIWRSTASDDSCVAGRATLLNSSMSGRSFVMGAADLNDCTMKDKAVVTDFVRARHVDIVGDSFLQGFASALAETDGRRTVRGIFSGTADALAPAQDAAPCLHRDGKTLFMPPDDFRAWPTVDRILASDASVIDETFAADASSSNAPDEGFDAHALARDRELFAAATRECGASTQTGELCTHRVGPNAQRCRAGHRVAGCG